MKSELKHIYLSVSLALVGMFLINLFASPTVILQKQFGGTAGIVPTATSTTYRLQIGSTTAVTIATSTPSNNCSATIITTGPRDMFFSIGSSSIAVPVVNGAGFVQPASTTVAYPAENYGCGQWTAVSYETSSSNASTSITTTRTY